MDHEHVPSSPIRRQQAAAHDQPPQDRPSTTETQRMMIAAAGPSDPNHAANVNNTHAWTTGQNDAPQWSTDPSSPSLKTFPVPASSEWTPPDQTSHAPPSPRSSHGQPSVLDPCAHESSQLAPWTPPSTGQWTSTPAIPNPYQWQRPDAVATPTAYTPASSSFCRSPKASTWASNTQPGPSNFKPTPFKTPSPAPASEQSTSSLLTSEPLVRVPTDAARATFRLGKRRRAASLPSAIPDVKRSRHHHEHLQPSETWQWHLDGPSVSTTPTPTPAPKIAKPAVAIPTAKSQSRLRRAPIVASRKPPINLTSLRTLDATELLRNHQLRHDLLFEPLAFRPVNYPNGGGPIDYPTIEMYWESIAREIQYGCRCTRWRVAECEDPFQPEILAARKMDTRCVCGGWMLSSGEDKWWAAQKAQWTSRIPSMVETLREILLSLMGSVSVCPDYLVHAILPESMSVHHGSCPSGTHDTVPGLYAALDPTFVTAQLRRGVLSWALFKQVGAAMKVHCAPVRDGMVDDMMATAERGDVVTALRKMFDCVEIMKLDIANHKIQAVRPHLWRSTIGYELAQFRATVPEATKLDSSLTKSWIRQASMRVLRAEGAARRSEVLSNRSAYLVRAINEGVMELICNTQWPSLAAWPPIGPRHRAGRTVTCPAEGITMPECLVYDAARFENHAQEVRELAFVHLLLSFFRETFEAENPRAGKRALDDAVALAKTEIDIAMDEGHVAFKVRPGSTSDLAFRLAMAAMPPLASRDRLAVARRAHEWAMAFDAYMLPNMRESTIYTTAIKSVRECMTKMLDGRMLVLLDIGALAEPASPPSGTADVDDVDDDSQSLRLRLQIRSATDIRLEEEAAMNEWKCKMEAKLEAEGMLAMQPTLVEVTERISKISQYNHGVFKDLYMNKGMMIGH